MTVKIEISKSQRIDREDICKQSPILLQAYNHLQIQWLGIEALEKSIIHHFSPNVKVGESPIALLILNNGIKEYSNLLNESTRRFYPHELMNAFIVGCLTAVKELCHFKIVDTNTNEKWAYTNEEDFMKWSENKSTLMIERSQNEDNQVDVRAVYFKHIPRNIKLAMRRFGHEQTIMGNHMAYSL